MKVVAFLIASLSFASAFAPASTNARVGTELNALFDNIFGMDLFDPSQNEYGARAKKNLKTGNLGDNSYIPAGLTKQQYEAIRKKEAQKKEENYKKNVAKAGKFTDFTEWYAKRGTDLSGAWTKSVTKGHTMVKTKYDYSGKQDAQKPLDQAKGSIFGKR